MIKSVHNEIDILMFGLVYAGYLSERLDLIRNDVKNKNGGDSWGTLYGRPVERLAFRYDRHEEIARYFGCGMYTIIQW